MMLPQKLDLSHIARTAFPSSLVTMQTNIAIVQINGGDPSVFSVPQPDTVLNPLLSYAVLYRYGAAVLYNVSDEKQTAFLDTVRVEPEHPPATVLHSEDYALLLQRGCPADFCDVTSDSILLDALTPNTFKVISQTLAQTVALEHAEARVATMLEVFRSMNANIERKGDFHLENKENLFKLIASNNSILTDVVSTLKILDRSEIAWRYGGQAQILWVKLREEFEISERFAAVDFKLQLVEQNTKFFLEVMHSQKSDSLEWAIIALLICEIILCLYEVLEKLSLRDIRMALTGIAMVDDDDD
ncbi:hypothetical protein PBRA_005769 [Plasmodiophora brassicae]|nr:hypothetical protein PBRA_005769 [Plasmodiophora brassicae]